MNPGNLILIILLFLSSFFIGGSALLVLATVSDYPKDTINQMKIAVYVSLTISIIVFIGALKITRTL